jgi:hypothetical protein
MFPCMLQGEYSKLDDERGLSQSTETVLLRFQGEYSKLDDESSLFS